MGNFITTFNERGDVLTQPPFKKEFHSFIGESTLAVASYMGHVCIGYICVNDESQSKFDDSKSIVIKESQFFLFTEALRKARFFFANHPDSDFLIDLQTGKRDPLYKLTASFGKTDGMSEPLFQLRYRW